MIEQFTVSGQSPKDLYGILLRTCGYGVPDFDKAVNCYKNSLTLIAEDTIQPFLKMVAQLKQML